MRRLLFEVLKDKVRRFAEGGSTGGGEPPWMTGFGALSDISDENRRVLALLEDEFERLSPEDAARCSLPDSVVLSN